MADNGNPNEGNPEAPQAATPARPTFAQGFKLRTNSGGSSNPLARKFQSASVGGLGQPGSSGQRQNAPFFRDVRRDKRPGIDKEAELNAEEDEL